MIAGQQQCLTGCIACWISAAGWHWPWHWPAQPGPLHTSRTTLCACTRLGPHSGTLLHGRRGAARQRGVLLDHRWGLGLGCRGGQGLRFSRAVWLFSGSAQQGLVSGKRSAAVSDRPPLLVLERSRG